MTKLKQGDQVYFTAIHPGAVAEIGTICKPRKSETPPSDDWFIVKFNGGGKSCIHRSDLTAA